MEQEKDGLNHAVVIETPYVDSFEVRRGLGDAVEHLVEFEDPYPAKDGVAHLVEVHTPYVDTFRVRRGPGDAVEHLVEMFKPYTDTFEVRRGSGDAVEHLVETTRPIEIKFTTSFDPKKRRQGARSLELFPQGKTDTAIFVIPINNYSKGDQRTFSLDLWHARLQNYDRADNVRISAFSFVKSSTPEGNHNTLGKEVVDNGYLYARKSGAASYTALSAGNYLNLGAMWPNDKITIDLKLDIPAGAVSAGRIMMGLLIEWQKVVIYGDVLYGEGEYGWVGGEKRITVRVHGLPAPNTTKDGVEHLVEIIGQWEKDGVEHEVGICA